MIKIKRINKLILLFTTIIALSLVNGFSFLSIDKNVEKPLAKLSEDYETKIIRPNHGVSEQWENSYYSYIQFEDAYENYESRSGTHTDIFDMSSNPPTVESYVVELKLCIYGSAYSEILRRIARLTVDVKIGDTWLGGKIITNAGGSFNKIYIGNWKTEQIDGIQIKTVAYIQTDGYVQLDCVYIEVKYKAIPPPKQLIGSNNRYFPNIEESKLGFTINTTQMLPAEPFIEFIIKEEEDPNSRNLRVYVDGIQIFEDSLDIDPGNSYSKTIPSPQLGNLDGHIIEIEINSGYYGTAPHTILEYLKVGRVDFIEFIEDNGNYYSPTYIKSEDEVMDYGTIALNTFLVNLYNPNGEIYDNKPWFLTPLIAAIDDDVEDDSGDVRKDYYIHRFRVEFRILDPVGNYLGIGQYGIQAQKTSAEADPDPSNYDDLVERLAKLLAHSIPNPYINLGAIVDFLCYLTGGETLTESTLIADDLLDGYFYVEWTVGTINHGEFLPPFDLEKGIAPRQKLKEISLWTRWDLNLQEDYGDYQLEIKWELDVKEAVRTRVYFSFWGIPYWGHWYEINNAFILTGSQYINLDFIP